MDRQAHWDTIYTTKAATSVSWYEPAPVVSMELITSVASNQNSVIDVGAGASLLVDRLVSAGFDRVAVLDISASALQEAKSRLGQQAARIQWIVADITTADSIGQFDVWHDRAVFHFLTAVADRRKYVELAERTVPVGGHLIVGTFALDGPAKCSGLEVCRYDSHRLAAEFAPAFKLVGDLTHKHTTPWGALQKFTFATFQHV
ncbi:MAG TPA: class I SAM-dependent methyltransferase [Humisphaera sp.]|nr:class I SAM-dependent methyltransferase [Humisphaera sp.]